MNKKSFLILLLMVTSCAIFVACGKKLPYEKPSEPILSATADSVSVAQPGDSNQYSYEFSQNDKDWQDDRVFSNLQPNTEYTIYLRRKADARHLASPSSNSKINTLKYENSNRLQGVYYAQNEKTVEILSDEDTIEISFDGVTYCDVKSHTYTENGEKTIYVRYKATNTHLASDAYELKVLISNFAFGKGTMSDPFIITKKDQLKITDTRYEEYFYYKLANDLDFENEFIENNLGNIYGEFDGSGYSIKNVIINYDGHKDSREIGLFGIVKDVKNLNLENIIISGDSMINDPPAGVNLGLLAGHIQNSALSCKALGKIDLILSGNTSAAYIGGLVGTNNGNIINCSTNIEIDVNSSASASIYVGGFAGRSKELSKSFAIGSIAIDIARPIFNAYAGGLLGNLSDKIENCYTMVSLTVESNAANVSVGGIAGENSLNAVPIIINSYSASTINILCTDRDTYVGGIIGRITFDGAAIENSFFIGNIANSTSGINPYNENTYVANTGDIIGYYEYFEGEYSYEIVNCYHSSSSDFNGNIVKNLSKTVNENSFKDQIWLETNLDWNLDVWLFKNNNLPILK